MGNHIIKMAYFKSSNDFLERACSDRSVRISDMLRTNGFLNKIRSLPRQELYFFRTGLIGITVFSFFSSIYFYRQARRQLYSSSESYYKLCNQEPIDLGREFWYKDIQDKVTSRLTYFYRMPLKEFDIKYRMRSASVTGEFDHDKEILIRSKKNGKNGYQVYTPFYYYYTR